MSHHKIVSVVRAYKAKSQLLKPHTRMKLDRKRQNWAVGRVSGRAFIHRVTICYFYSYFICIICDCSFFYSTTTLLLHLIFLSFCITLFDSNMAWHIFLCMAAALKLLAAATEPYAVRYAMQRAEAASRLRKPRGCLPHSNGKGDHG